MCPSITEMEVSRVARVVYSAVHAVCASWLESFPRLTLPNRAVDVSHHAIRNTRRKMEDRHVTLPYLNHLFNMQVCGIIQLVELP